jgi:hypothetical protein
LGPLPNGQAGSRRRLDLGHANKRNERSRDASVLTAPLIPFTCFFTASVLLFTLETFNTAIERTKRAFVRVAAKNARRRSIVRSASP